MPRTVITNSLAKKERQDLFLKNYPKSGTISRAAVQSKISPRTPEKWLKEDPEFAGKFEKARKEFVEYLEGIAVDLVGEMHANLDYKSNPTLLIFMLNANNPEKYRGIADSSSEARDLLNEFRRAAQATVVTVKKVEHNTRAAKTVSEWEEGKLALKEKFGSLSDDNGDEG